MRKIAVLFLMFISFSAIQPVPEADILPESLLAFPFGSEDYKHKIFRGLENASIWSENRIEAWAQAQGFRATTDNPAGGYQYHRGIVFYPPGISFTLKAPVSARGERQSYGWKIYLDFSFFYSPRMDQTLSTNFNHYENILRYEVYLDNILFKTIEIGFGVTERSPVVLEIPYLRDPSGKVVVDIRLKNHPANFGILYDAFLSLD